MPPKKDLVYFKKHLKWLTCLGIDINPVENVWYAIIYRTYAWLLFIYVLSYSLLELIDIVNSSDFNSMTFGLSYSVTHILGAAKIGILIVKKKVLRQMLLKLESDYFLPNMERGGEKEFIFVNAAIRRANLHADIFNTLVYLIIGIRCLYAIFDKGTNLEYLDEHLNTTMTKHIRTLPYKAWLPVDLNKSPAYEIMFIIQASCLILYGFYICFLDSLVYGMMFHMNNQYLILRHILNRYVPIAKSIVLKRSPNIFVQNQSEDAIQLPTDAERTTTLTGPVLDAIEQIIYYCSKYHLEIVDYCGKIEDEFSYLMLMQFLSSLYILCFQLFQLSLEKMFRANLCWNELLLHMLEYKILVVDSKICQLKVFLISNILLVSNYLSFDSISMCLYLILMMYQLFGYCWYGNEVMIQSLEISTDVYKSEWLATNESTKKALLLIMMRAQRPIYFTAGKFAMLSLPTYMTIVRGSASYFMVLQQMQ